MCVHICIVYTCGRRCLCTCVYMYVEAKCSHLDHSLPYLLAVVFLADPGIQQVS